jgi:hypothetical protein
MEDDMKTLATIAAFATLVASPAFAQNPKASDVVTFGQQYVGQDPDPAVRSQLTRDHATHLGGN